jgi:hypothetical protein
MRRSARVARSRGVPVVPLKETREHLLAVFDDPLERSRVIMVYDHIDDVIVFNPDHEAWDDMASYLQKREQFFSTSHPQHLVRHEIGHAVHYRSLSASPAERDRIWFAENLEPGHLRLGQRVSGRAMWNPKEFVAEVFAGLWATISYDEEVIALFDQFKGVKP